MPSSRFAGHVCRNLFFVCCLLGLAAVSPARAADGNPVAQDIAGAGRLRLQSQRLAKLYQQAALGLNAPAALQQIATGSAEVDAEFVHLLRYGKKSNVQRTYARSEALWQDMKSALKIAPASASVERVGQLADELMLHAGKLAMQIEAESETPVGRLLDLSSRLNMLAQRLARLYLQAQGGDRSQGVLTDIEQARKEFATGLQELDSARENTVASREAIALAKNQWIFFDSAVSRLGGSNRSDPKAVQNVVTSSERIAQVLEASSAQYLKDYAEAAARQPK